MTATAANANAYAQQIADFNRFTRHRNYVLPSQTRASGALLRFDLPPTALIARINIEIRGVMNALTGTPNAYGMSSIIRNIRVQSNMGDDLFNVDGRDYFGLLAPVIDFPGNALPHSSGWTAIASSGVVILPVVIPLAVNLRDATGLIPAQNRQTVLTLWIDCETDANLASTSLTWTTQPVITPTVEVFTIPFMPTAQPPLAMIHRIIGRTEAIAATGNYDHTWERGNIVLQKLHNVGGEVTTPADDWTTAEMRVGQTDTWYNYTPNSQDTYFGYRRLQTRRAGMIYFDFLGQSGLGPYDIPRDAVDMRRFTDVVTRINASTTNTLRTVTRYLQPL